MKFKYYNFLFISFGLAFAQDARANKFQIETYRVTVNVQDRYVRTEVAVQVKNNLSGTGQYQFGVKLDEKEFISSLTMRVQNQCWYRSG